MQLVTDHGGSDCHTEVYGLDCIGGGIKVRFLSRGVDIWKPISCRYFGEQKERWVEVGRVIGRPGREIW